MSSVISKRSQARNERAIQELIKTVPGNDRCADCQARNPGWASWSLGIFLCMRCATLHRKLGTHVSKVKSLSMDSWSNEQVEIMKRNGNLASNGTYNPQSVKPSIPLDIDEVGSAMERFIRQKYEQRLFSRGSAKPNGLQNTSSTRSSEELPPPLPPKPGKRFGFSLRASSSTFPLSRTARESQPEYPVVRTGFPGPPSPVRVNKQSRVFGASIGGTGATLEEKLATLKDMGFPDEKRNSTVLKGLSGNLERAVETLVRLGEGNVQSSLVRMPLPPQNPSTNGWPTDLTPKALSPVKSNNPFDQPTAQLPTHDQPAAQPTMEQANSDGGFVPNPYGQSTSNNPFNASIQTSLSTQNLEQTFQNMHVSQPLFPHATGGYPSQQQQLQQARYQQSMTPPVPQLPQQFAFSSYMQHQQSPPTNYNPFFQPTQQQTSNPYTSPQPPPASTNPYATQSYNNDASFIQSQPIQLQAQQQQQQYSNYPQQYPIHETPQYTYQQPQPLLPQQTGRIDKSSILALYNYPQLAPSPLQNPPTDPTTLTPSDQPPLPKLPTGVSATSHGQRSATMPAVMSAGSRNPFLPTGGVADGGDRPAPQVNGGGSRHVSQESVDVGGFQTGRHSPDAFASLSARYVR